MPVVARLGRLARRLRYGAPIIVVSGLPRSGTSMMMRMLEAGGVMPLDDGLRAADESNPRGYFEFEPVKELDTARGDVAWLPAARGKAVKIISFLLTWLPEHYNYQVIFMQRDLDEVLASQQQMLSRRRAAGDAADAARSRDAFASHLAQVERFMTARACFATLYVPYGEAVAAPEATAVAVARFLDRSMDTAAMARAVDASLYRNRS
ncbi:MAG: sulfotransferase family protein [Acidobacteria bacterium]|nr:sulfotransferase family protein [Acidobacteriota bacterium]